MAENKRVVDEARFARGIDVRPKLATMTSPDHGSFPDFMAAPVRFLVLLLASTLVALAGPPSALVSALEYLRDQKSYSWEMINGDPGPVAQQFETRRGTVTTVQQSMSPNMKGQIDRSGTMPAQ